MRDDEDIPAQTAAECGPLLPQQGRASSADTPLLVRQNSDPHRMRHRSSAWETDSTTPMTTRPHFEKAHISPLLLKRIRSRSLGAEVDAVNGADSSSLLRYKHLWVPPLSHGAEQLVTATKDEEQEMILESSSTGETAEQEEELFKEEAKKGTTATTTPIWISIMYGLINSTIVLPVLLSFGSIIYRNNAFANYMPVLIRLTLVSGVVHQLCFSTFSSLPFAVGQVQDAGLIFLSGMASSMVEYCRRYHHDVDNVDDDGDDDETMLATVTIGLALCTALLGVGLVVVGRLKLAQYVQMLPTSVVGGYLAFIGWFCGTSGVGLMAGSSDVTLKIVQENIVFVLPGVVGGIVIYVAVRTLRHMAVLPICILLELILFYLILWATGASIDDVTNEGWIRKTDPPPPWYHTWDYLRLNKVVWSALPQLALTELSMIFVVALSSSLDVAAIEIEMNQPLNYNHELTTVGISNIVSGLTGGYTGSYIFSQSIFSLRAGIRSRLAGYVLAMCQIVFLFLPIPILAYIPNFFFGSLLSMICVDLMFEWLWDVRHRVTIAEYIICLATFGLIQLLGVEFGILAGVLLYFLCSKLGLNVGDPKIATLEAAETEVLNEDISMRDRSSVQYGSIS